LGFTGGGSGSGTGTAVPIGGCIPFGGAGAPSGFVLCDGAAISRITFGNLFAIIGTQYGIGDGATTFNVPDMRTSNSFARGATNDAGRGTTGGLGTVSLVAAENAAHVHTITDGGHVHGGGVKSGVLGYAAGGSQDNGTAATVSATTGITIDSQGSGDAHENKPPFVDFNWIIKV